MMDYTGNGVFSYGYSRKQKRCQLYQSECYKVKVIQNFIQKTFELKAIVLLTKAPLLMIEIFIVFIQSLVVECDPLWLAPLHYQTRL
jgi:hypothetical protein